MIIPIRFDLVVDAIQNALPPWAQALVDHLVIAFLLLLCVLMISKKSA